jgi:hypothetical protein
MVKTKVDIKVTHISQEHPTVGTIYVTVVEDAVVSVVGDSGWIDFDTYDGYLCIDNYVTKIGEDNFIKRGF